MNLRPAAQRDRKASLKRPIERYLSPAHGFMAPPTLERPPSAVSCGLLPWGARWFSGAEAATRVVASGSGMPRRPSSGQFPATQAQFSDLPIQFKYTPPRPALSLFWPTAAPPR